MLIQRVIPNCRTSPSVCPKRVAVNGNETKRIRKQLGQLATPPLLAHLTLFTAVPLILTGSAHVCSLIAFTVLTTSLQFLCTI